MPASHVFFHEQRPVTRAQDGARPGQRRRPDELPDTSLVEESCVQRRERPSDGVGLVLDRKRKTAAGGRLHHIPEHNGQQRLRAPFQTSLDQLRINPGAEKNDEGPAAVTHLAKRFDLLRPEIRDPRQYDEIVGGQTTSLELDPDCDAAAFRLGFDHARKGRLDAALEHYAAIASRTATYFNALINLGVLCEDRREYSTAIECYRRVLRSNPNHTRARMYLKDAHASLDMVYDEDRQRELDRRQQLLAIPVTDFELSVRVRNCLQRMNIITVGDLAHHTEEELLTSKNFGETSLQEIKEMLVARGLRLGQDREDLAEPTLVGAPELGITPASPPDELVLSTPISELDLSLRSRKCMERLGLATIGQLCERSADELLGSRNFGRTSLAEVGEKLARYGLALRQPPPEETEDEDDDEAPPIDDGQ